MNQHSQPIIDLIHTIANTLTAHFVLPEEHAWWIVEAITGKKKATLIARETISLSTGQQATLDQWLDALINQQIPLQYLIGNVPFGDLEILVEPPILIPRPETEEWCLDLIDQLHTLQNQKLTILDLCTGSGCIALILAHALPKATVFATDISNKALALAKKNSIHNQIPHVTFLNSDLFNTILPEFTFDLIISNPPYIAESEWASLTPSVTEWEDRNALIAADNGLALIEKIIQNAPTYLTNNAEMADKKIPQLIIEIGYLQGDAVQKLLQKYAYTNAGIKQDSAHKDRIAYGNKP